MEFIPAIICAVATASLVFAEFSNKHDLQKVFKPIAAVSFVAQAIVSGAFDSSFGMIILGSLIFCALGDVFLLPRGKQLFFLAGMGSFALGHLGYVWGFSALGLPPISTYWMPALIVVLCGSAAFLWINSFLPKEMKIPVLVYTFIIMSMVVTSIGAVQNGASIILMVAAISFAVSDVFVARDRFQDNSPWNSLIISPLYFGAQVLFALSV